LQQISDFLFVFFEAIIDLRFALCSYEITGFLMGGIEKIDEFDDIFLRQFPIVYQKEPHADHLKLDLNLDAQYIFGTPP
jgi:hypothetical protein